MSPKDDISEEFHGEPAGSEKTAATSKKELPPENPNPEALKRATAVPPPAALRHLTRHKEATVSQFFANGFVGGIRPNGPPQRGASRDREDPSSGHSER